MSSLMEQLRREMTRYTLFILGNDEYFPTFAPKLLMRGLAFVTRHMRHGTSYRLLFRRLAFQRFLVSTMNLKLNVFLEGDFSFVEALWQPFNRTNRSPLPPLLIVVVMGA